MIGNFFKAVGKFVWNKIQQVGWAGGFNLKNAFLAYTTVVGVKGFLQAKQMLAKGQDIMANKTAAGGKIPVIYGTRRVGAQIVYMDTAQNRSKDLFVVYAISVGECEEILGRTIEIDGNSILDGNIYKGGGYVGSDKISSGSGSLNTASQVGDNQYSNAGTLGTDPTLRYSFVFNLHHGASSQTADPMLRASIPTEWTTNHKLNGICYIAASFDYDKKGMYKGVPQITVQVKGKKVYDPRTDTTAWSSNPALCFLDYIQNDEYGKGLATSQINMTTISAAANKCDTLVDQPYYNGNYQDVTWSGDSGDDFIVIDDNADWWQNKVDEVIDIRDANDAVIFDGVDIKGTTRYEFYDATQENRLYIDGTLSSSYTNEAGSAKAKVKRFHCNGYIDTNKNVMDNAKELLANMRGILNYVNGKYELQIEDTGSSTFSITDNHIIADAGISVDYGNKDKKANKVVVEFFNANKKYELDTATVLHDASPDYYSDDGEVLEIKAEFPYVTDPYIAYNMGKAILTRSRNQTTMQFLGTPEMYKLNVGDIVDLTYAGLGFSGKVCRVEALELQANGLVSVSLIEYFDVYTWEVPAQESTEILAKIPTIGALKPPQASSIVFTDTDASSINRPTLTWTEPTDFPVRQYRVDVVDSSDNNVFSKIVDTPSVDLAFLPKAANYEASITSFNGVGIESNASTKTFTIADDPVKTTEVEMNGVTLSTVETYGTVTNKSGNWVKFLNKTNFGEVVEFDNGLIVDSGTARFENAPTFVDGFTGQGTFEISQGSIQFGSYTPSTTTNRLYNVGGSLYWNGQALGTGTGDITAVVAGTNLNGGGTSGSVTLNLDSTITGDHTFSNNIIIQGNLTVQGTTTSVNTDDLNVKDKNITLNYSIGDSSASANGAGITIQDAVSATQDATLTWNTANDSFNFSHNLNFADNVKAQFGDDNDLQIYHDGNNSRVEDTGTGGLRLIGGNFVSLQSTSGENMVVATENGAVTLYHNNASKLTTTSTGVEITGNLDSPQISINDYISHNGDSNTYFGFDSADTFALVTGGTTAISADANATYLRYQGSAKLATTSSGIDVTGTVKGDGLIINGGATSPTHLINGSRAGTLVSIDNESTSTSNGLLLNTASTNANSNILQVTSNDLNRFKVSGNGDIIFYDDTGVSQNLKWDASADSLNFVDNAKAQFGAGNDIQIYHNGITSNGNIENHTGSLYITNYADDQDIIFRSDDGSGNVATYFQLDGSQAQLKVHKNMVFFDNVKASFGDSADLQIYHNGSNSYIDDAGQGALNIRSNGLFLEKYTGEVMITAIADGAVTLYHNNNAKLATTSSGIDVTGTTLTDGLTVNSGGTSSYLSIRNGSNSSFTKLYSDLNGVTVLDVDANNVGAAPRFQIDVSEVQALRITEGGDISFYDDTGSTQGLFWDASAESLCLGNTSAGAKFDIRQDSGYAIRAENNLGSYFRVAAGGNTEIGGNVTLSSTAPLLYLTNTTSGTGKAWRFSSASNGKLYITQEGVIDAVTLEHTTGNATFAGTVTSDGLTVAGSNANLILGTTGNDITFTRNSDNYISATGGTSSNIVINPQNRFVVNTGGSERARIDSSGNLLVGTTSTNPQDGDHGFVARANGYTLASVDNARAMLVNRASSDGDIISLAKAGTIVGSIGVGSSNKMTIIGTNANLQLGANNAALLNLDTNKFYPQTDNSVDLGFSSSANRFKDLYLSGTAYANNINIQGSFTVDNEYTLPSASGSAGQVLKYPATGSQVIWADDDTQGTTINNNADNRIITGSGTANTLNAEANFTYDGSRLTTTSDSALGTTFTLANTNSGGGREFTFISNSTGNFYIYDDTANTTRFTIDSAGNVLVGKTSLTIANAGTEVRNNGQLLVTADGDNPVDFNRLTSDGTIANFRKDSTVVGSIGTQGGVIRVGSGNNNLGFFATRLQPLNSSGVGVDGTIDLGYSTSRFKDLRLSGNAYIGSSAYAQYFGSSADTNTLIQFAGSDDIRFRAGGTEQMRIKTTGVGIGTSSPSEKLEIASNASVNMKLNNTGQNITLEIGAQSSAARITAGSGDRLGLGAGNTQDILNIASGGKVGIGTTSPSHKLDIAAGDIGLDSGRTLYLGSDSNVSINSTSSSRVMRFYTGGSERARIDSSGRLLVGTTSVGYSGVDLTVGATTDSQNGVSIQTSTTGIGYLLFGDGTGASAYVGQIAYAHSDNSMQFDTAGAERMRIDSSGNVGIGTSSPARQFHVHDASASYLHLTNNTTGSTGSDGASISMAGTSLQISNRENGVLQMYTNGTERMRLDSSGNVGIGTSSPSAKLEVKSSGSNADEITLVHSGNTVKIASLGQESSHGSLILRNNGGANRVRLSAGGNDSYLLNSNFGIGTTSVIGKVHADDSGGATLTLTRTSGATSGNLGKIRFGNTNVDSDLASIVAIQDGATNNSALTFGTQTAGYAVAERMRITSSGNVGIGTASPSHLLSVGTEGNSSGKKISLYLGGTNGNYSAIGAQRAEDNTYCQSEIRFINENNSSGLGAFAIATGNNNLTERLRIDSSGRFIVGGTTAGETNATTIYPTGNITSGSITATGSGVFNFNKTETYNPVITANDSESDTGQIIALQIGGTTKGNIGISSATGNDMYIASGTTSSAGFGLRFIDYTVTNAALPCRGDGSTVDNLMDLGNSGSRFDDIYATNSTINTSDRNEKQDIQTLTDAEQRVATACKGLIRRFRWQDAVEKKGDDARYHFGVMAQDLQDAFEAEGLDAGDYGMFISSTWTDDDGNEKTRLGVRYNELLAFIITTL